MCTPTWMTFWSLAPMQSNTWIISARFSLTWITMVSKCVLGAASLNFLCFHGESQGIRPMEDKVIQDFPLPPTQRKLRESLGLVKFYHSFIPSCTLILQYFYVLLKMAPKGIYCPTCLDRSCHSCLLVHQICSFQHHPLSPSSARHANLHFHQCL